MTKTEKNWLWAAGAAAVVLVGLGLYEERKAYASTPLVDAAKAARDAITADPNYCTDVATPGSVVNNAVHDFKAAWNAANPNNTVPIGTGKFESSVANALNNLLGTNLQGCP